MGQAFNLGLPRRFVKRNRQTPTSRIHVYPKNSREERPLGWSQERGQVWDQVLGLGAGLGMGLEQGQGLGRARDSLIPEFIVDISYPSPPAS